MLSLRMRCGYIAVIYLPNNPETVRVGKTHRPSRVRDSEAFVKAGEGELGMGMIRASSVVSLIHNPAWAHCGSKLIQAPVLFFFLLDYLGQSVQQSFGERCNGHAHAYVCDRTVSFDTKWGAPLNYPGDVLHLRDNTMPFLLSVCDCW